MAKRTIQMLIDDIDGGEADETVRFALDGIQYEIDLSSANALRFRGIMEQYQEAGTIAGRSPVTPGGRVSRSRNTPKVDRDQTKAIREWAQSVGIEVADRGRIKREVVDRFNAAHS